MKTTLLIGSQRFVRRLGEDWRTVCRAGVPARARGYAAVRGMARLAAIALALLLGYTLLLIPFTPAIADLRKAKVDQPSILLSADGQQIAQIKRLNREWVELDQISPHVIEALIATEDHRFYQHIGVDLRRIAAGIVRTIMGDPQGGSTLTQQLARNLYPQEIGRERTLTRKLKEIITAFKIEYAYSKQEILLTYLNTMPFLYNAFGIEMGARTYFDKPAAQLDVLESATLIGMLKGTSYYNPVQNPERSQRRRNVVLAQMLKRGVLSAQQFDTFKRRPLELNFERQQEAVGIAPHFTAHVRKWLIEWADRHDYNLYADGLIIHTTLDARLQGAANDALARQTEALQAIADVEWASATPRLISTDPRAYAELRRRMVPFAHFWNAKPELVDAFLRESPRFRQALTAGATPQEALARLRADQGFMERLREEKTRLQAGLVAIDPHTGHIKAWVGSRDFALDQYDHVAQARRQPGSTFKPLVYGAAFEQGLTPDARYIDVATEITMPDGTVWQPSDMAAPSGRAMTVRDALIHSKNTITAQLMQEVGPQRAIALARKAGIRYSLLEPVPALALGTSPVSLLEMTSVYATIAARGDYRAPQAVLRITDAQGRELARFGTRTSRAMATQTADYLIDILRGAVNYGTGQAIRHRFGITADVAGKTGTTQHNTDGWFMLMHPQLATGAWVGFNDARVTMRGSYWGQGGHNALFIVGDFYRHALQARSLDGRQAFTKPGASLFDAIADRLDKWLVKSSRYQAATAASGKAPAMSEQNAFDDDAPHAMPVASGADGSRRAAVEAAAPAAVSDTEGAAPPASSSPAEQRSNERRTAPGAPVEPAPDTPR